MSGVRSRVIDDAHRSHSEPPGWLSELSQFLAEGAAHNVADSRIGVRETAPASLRYRELITVLMAWVVHESASIGSRRSLARAGAGRGRDWLRGYAGRSRRRRALRWRCSRVG